ncbi:hypothetical protein DFS34DRAFT_27815 [Phlyctochytrium arcticum]|nr:hypothetical protein DFS34DRAFT_27815 [Phlyctochytrium arcticum]
MLFQNIVVLALASVAIAAPAPQIIVPVGAPIPESVSVVIPGANLGPAEQAVHKVQAKFPNRPSKKILGSALAPARVGPNNGQNAAQLRATARNAAIQLGLPVGPVSGAPASASTVPAAASTVPAAPAATTSAAAASPAAATPSSAAAPAATTVPAAKKSVTATPAPKIPSPKLAARQATTPLAYLDQPCGADVNTKAAPGLCCSQWGWAGVTTDHCGTGCQKTWGRCNDNVVIPVYTSCSVANSFALTFDDGPSVLTTGLLDYLKTAAVRATFFINGINWKNVETKNPLPGLFALKDVVVRAKAEGHQICSHTWSHIDMLSSISDQYNITYEVTRLNHAFREILGTIPTCIRPPYGDYDSAALKVLRGLGYYKDTALGFKGAVVNWNLDPVDWDPSVHGSTIAAQVTDLRKEYVDQTAGVTAAKSKFITLNHDVHNTTADFRPNGQLLTQTPPVKPLAQQAVEYIKTKGYRFVTIDECLGFPVGSMYRAPTMTDENCGYGDGSACYQ